MNSAARTDRLSIYSTRLFENQVDGKQGWKIKTLNKMNKPVKYVCPKCGSRTCTTGEIRTTGSFLTKIFDIQNRRFTSVTCNDCKYTEFYNLPSKMIGNVLDFFTS
jgi:predicted nucleic-acid-binding Zn-ribbon protein